MRRKVSLYIGGHPVDLDDQSFILFNYTMNDSTNPTIVKNSFSQQVTIPATFNNRGILSGFGRLDHQVTSTGFNPMARTPFTIYNELGEILESGYVRLDKVNRRGRDVQSYTLTMYGGLGSLLYGLSYGSDGNALTLASLSFPALDGSSYTDGDDADTDITNSWYALSEGELDGYYGIFNFVPMYNGIPSDNFDANKAITKAGVYDNLPGQMTNGGATYRPKGGTNAPYIITFESNHTEWDMSEIRSYFQRPCINVARLLDAFVESAHTLTGKTLYIDSSVYNDTHGIDSMWVTLPLISTKYRSRDTISIGELLEETKSPAEYLIGLAKVFGWVFRTEPQRVTLMTRDAWYNTQEATIDLTGRVDVESVDVEPVYAESRFFDFILPGIGEDAEAQVKNTGREYGSVRVDTNYAFNDDVNNVLDGTPFKASANVMERSLSFVSAFFTQNNSEVDEEFLPQTAFEKVTATMYKVENGSITDSSSSLDLGYPAGLIAKDNALFYDWMGRFQAHDADGKAEDGQGILMYFNGMKDTPAAEYDDGQGISIVFPRKRYYLTSYDANRVTLNGGKDCWDMRHITSYVTSLPEFVPETTTHILQMAGNNNQVGIYGAYWKKYISDIYDKDTCRMTAKVNLSGMQVNSDLLRRFYWFDGSLWVLNRITNYSLTTYDPVECEFIRVQDKDNYINGQS